MSVFKEEKLGSGISCFVSDEHTFGTDAVLLADFANPTSRSKCCDLGSGCGIIPLLWCKKPVGEITAVEIQEKAVNQINEAVTHNSLSDKITVVHSDLRDLKGKVPLGYFNIVTMNPPYTAIGSGIESSGSADKIARHDSMCTFSDVCTSASKLLNFGGKLCMCIRPERMTELFLNMIENRIEPKRIRFISKCPGKQPWLVLVEGKRGGNRGLTVCPELFVYGNDNEYSDEMKNIYKDYLLENRGDEN